MSRSCSHLGRFQRRVGDASRVPYHRTHPEIGNGRHADMDPALYNRLQAWSRNSIRLLAAVNTSFIHLSGDLCLSNPSIKTIAYSRASLFTTIALLPTSLFRPIASNRVFRLGTGLCHRSGEFTLDERRPSYWEHVAFGAILHISSRQYCNNASRKSC